jgi:NTE family protein
MLGDGDNKRPRVAIACQGGGSHTAFTAGALKQLLKAQPSKYEIVGLSGTSGGAICALLAWYGLLKKDSDTASTLLDAFWRDTSARSFKDQLVNRWILWGTRVPGIPEVSPYFYPAWGQANLRRTLEKYVAFADLERLVQAKGPSCPRLLVSAVDVLSGHFRIFKAAYNHVEVSVDAMLASAALPRLFPAVRIGTGVYWDGLFSQNPPIRNFVTNVDGTYAKPDEIWVIQINPQRRSREPRLIDEIQDRTNELAGNLSLNQEIYFIETVDKWLAQGLLNKGDEYKQIKVRRIELLRELHYISKLDRSPAFIQEMMIYGERQAADFLNTWPEPT